MIRQSVGPVVRSIALGAVALASASVVGSGCLDRPVVPTQPTVTARVVDRAKQNKVSKIDLLFMIDNSSSMADKQTILANVVGDLVNRLVNPACIDPMTGLVVGMRQPDGSCATGEPDFDPVNDIHIGIISSSLGSHGATLSTGAEVCPDPDPSKTNAHNKDMSHLLNRSINNGVETPVTGPAIVATAGGGFLNWTGMGNSDTLIVQPFQTMVTGVGQHGCGYEAQLESIYRFLNDPNPYARIDVVGKTGSNPGNATLVDTDQAVIQQRKDFLRPDSLVAVIAVTDENDCSINDSFPQGFYALLPPVSSSQGQISQLRRGTSACDTNPNDPCCVNCGQPLPQGCTDTACANGGDILPRANDPENLRCSNQKKRYGVDFLYPVDRYIEGFASTKVHDVRSNPPGALVDNPLYTDLTCVNGKNPQGQDCTTASARDPSFVFFTGIVGVPWQDIAVDPNDLSKGFKTSTEINNENIWKNILGDPHNPAGPILPTDPHMIESIQPRPGLPGPDTAPPGDPINGHEWATQFNGPPNADLQYACIFDLPGVTQCTAMNLDCDCNDGTNNMGGTVADMKNPLCWDKTNNTYGHGQIRAKAYPGLRELEVLKGIGDQAIVASTCPARVAASDINRPDYGYRPAISALVSRLRAALRGRCLPRTLELNVSCADGTTPCTDPANHGGLSPDYGNVPCVVIEAYKGPCQPCAGNMTYRGRAEVPPGSPLITSDIADAGICFCELLQIQDRQQRIDCETKNPIPNTVSDGWCYVDPAQQTGDLTQACSVVATCPDTDKRVVRFAHAASEPRAGGTAFITCQEKSFAANSSSSSGMTNPCP